MEGSGEFLQQLTDALSKRSQWLEGTQIPRLKESLQGYQNYFEAIMQVLIRKGLLREDPYNYEQTMTDITVPSDAPLPDFENTDETSYRLAAFRRQLKFVMTDLSLALSDLKLGKLKKLSALLSYVNWSEFSDTASSPVTRSFARSFTQVLLSGDITSAHILKEQEGQILRVFHDCQSIIADLATFHRESWKADVRRTVLPQVSLEPAGGPGKKDDAVRALRKAYGKEMEGRPWYPALAQELIAEETESDAEARRARLLASLAIPEPVAVEDATPRESKPILMEAVRILSRPHEELIAAVESLSETERLLQAREGGIGHALRRLFGRSQRPKTDSHTYEITFSEPAQGTTKSEKVNFPQFAEGTRKKATLLAAISSGSGPAYKRIQGASESSLAAFVDKQLNEMLLIHRRLAGFNTLFQARAAQAGKQGVRGIKLELLTIRNSIVKANQRRHEYGERAETAKEKQTKTRTESPQQSPA